MKTFYDRYHRQHQSTILPNAILNAFNDRLQRSKRYKVYQSGNSIYQVEIPDTGIKHIVDLEKKTCECTNFQEYESPCTHAIAACRYASIDPFKKFRKYYKLRVYRETYSWFVQPVSIQDLESDPNIHPPIIKKQRGRPKTKRIRKGAYKRKPKQCSICKEFGHDKRSCRKQPIANGRRQRARDRELSDTSSINSTDSSEISGEVSDQFDVEMALYDQRHSQALLAIRRMEASLISEPMSTEGIQVGETIVVDSNSTVYSDSELSIVSSSRFSGLEEDWWKETAEASSDITGTVIRTRSKGKRVHWE